MILGVPTFAVIYYIVNMLVNNRLKRKKLPTDTSEYDKYGYVDSDGNYIRTDKNIKDEGENNNADSSTE